MMKKKNRIITGALCTLGLSLAIGSALLVSNNDKYQVAQAYEYDDTNDTLTFQPIELNEYVYTYLADQMLELTQEELAEEITGYITNEEGLTTEMYNLNVVSLTNIQWVNTNNMQVIYYNLVDNTKGNKGQWTIYQNNEQIRFNNPITLNDAEWVYEHMNAPMGEGSGTDIINSIKSGLGLIGDLAEQFLNGFTTLFWNSTDNTLSNFGLFSLVMLGVAITFSVIALCLNVLRSNTGV